MSKVAVITRTKDRPLLLPRVLESLRFQTFRDFVWVLVNDAGINYPVDEVVKKAKEYNIKTIALHRSVSTGMEAASNHGISCCESKYIVIHDDDDSWEEHFLEKTVSYLESNNDAQGVVTWANKIVEKIDNEKVCFVKKTPYNHWLLNIYISDMAIENRFPPISFLFRRSVYDLVKGFDESLPVLGDWDFNLKVLLEGDIHVIPESLANYHFRESVEQDDVYGNTVTAGIKKHIVYDAAYRNRRLREDLISGKNGLGTILAIGQSFKRVNNMATRFNFLYSTRRTGFFDKFLFKGKK